MITMNVPSRPGTVAVFKIAGESFRAAKPV